MMFPPYGPSSPVAASVAVRAIARQQYNVMSSAAGLGVALEHLALERRPDLAVEIVERALDLDLGDVTRSRQGDLPIADDARGGPRRHDHHAVGERDRLLEIMGDEQHRLAIGAPQIQQQVAHDLPRLRIERAERLVHQQYLGVADEHLHEAHALPLAARQHVRIARAELGEADAGEPSLRALARRRARDAGGLEPDRDVLQRGLPREQRVRLEQVAGLAVERGERHAENVDAARGRRDQPGGDVEQRRLTAAGRADDGHELAVGHRKRGVFDRGIGAPVGEPERHRHLCERNGGRRHGGGAERARAAAAQLRLRSTSARCLIHGIMVRSFSPICSIGCAAILARMALNEVWLTRFSSIQSLTNLPDWMSPRIFFISARVASLTTRGPETYSPYSAVLETE